MKAQWIRLADVYVVGPVMIATARSVRPRWLGFLAGAFGLLTIIYNGENWRRAPRGSRA
jgi:hypothetical protein